MIKDMKPNPYIDIVPISLMLVVLLLVSVFVRTRVLPQVELPNFQTMQEFMHSPWKEYYLSVYGNLPRTPPKPADLWMIYTKIYNKAFKTNLKTSVYSTFCPSRHNNLYSNMSGTNDIPETIWLYKKPPYQPLPSNSWVEISHCANKVAKNREKVGAWYYYAPGSGVYLNLGKTKVYQKHPDAVKDILKETCFDSECDKFYPKLFKTAKEQGYDTIQFLNHTDMRCGNTAIEIVDTAGVGTFACGDSKPGKFRTGYQATLPCVCDNKKLCSNCGIK